MEPQSRARNRAQGSMEYIMLLAGVLIVVAVIIGVVMVTSQDVADAAGQGTGQTRDCTAYCYQFATSAQCNQTEEVFDGTPSMLCNWDPDLFRCMPDPDTCAPR